MRWPPLSPSLCAALLRVQSQPFGPLCQDACAARKVRRWSVNISLRLVERDQRLAVLRGPFFGSLLARRARG